MRRVGVEEELLLVDARTGAPVPGYDAVAQAARLARDEPAEHELKQEMAEIASAPHLDLAEIRADLEVHRRSLAKAAASRGFAAAATASSPVAGRPVITAEQRYLRMEQRFGLLERNQLTCGMHVHVAIDSPEQGVAALDRMRPWLPILIALSANSPFWQGEDTAYASYRTVVWGQWPSAGPTETFGSLDQYRRLVDDLTHSGTLLDEGMVYFDARLSRHYPTIEVRVADVCTDVSDAIMVAAIVRALVETALGQAEDGLPPDRTRTELLRVASWSAARYGTTADLVDPATARPIPAADLIDRLMDLLAPSLRTSGDQDLVADGVAAILRRGTGSEQQRRHYSETTDLGAVALDVARRTTPEPSPGTTDP
ncbi:glutamate--cysteine ligase [Jatrophihabitans telluris]|uniref:Putative glutamate--cysteine ligase 2 n=1 Tax=Jatrophihabitans telluris TaxID=2038343 RepID=A0ABY4QZG4_9ACTN|nr:glutamate--cysteine ligase [Jatrophihabitans telluris]UQX88723.1 glutamate--cysteine ligase [Jatrophihabitans telluris]